MTNNPHAGFPVLPKQTHMTQDEIQKVQQALMLADMFFCAVPASQGSDINPLGKVLSEAVGITLKYTD